MIQIALFKMNDAPNVINKTLENPLMFNINFKSDVDLTNPIIKLLNDGSFTPTEYNYAEIPDFGRMYFIDDVININHKIVQFNLRCDVIESYKDEILASKARLYRNIKNGDYYSGSMDFAETKSITKYPGNKGIVSKQTIILTTVGAV